MTKAQETIRANKNGKNFPEFWYSAAPVPARTGANAFGHVCGRAAWIQSRVVAEYVVALMHSLCATLHVINKHQMTLMEFGAAGVSRFSSWLD